MILNKGPWEYRIIVIKTGLSAHKGQLLQMQMHYKIKMGQGKLKE
jgi:hypothetical protein